GEHPLLSAILRDGFREKGGAIPADVSIDSVRPPGKTMEVMDSDGSHAEKLAALEVVKRRLESVGLGELCLELHSNKASKKEVAGDLARTLSLGRPRMPATADQGLAELREKLNKYARAASTPVGSSDVTPYHAI